MCGRGVRPEGPELIELLEAAEIDDEVRDLTVRYNLAPTQPVAVLWRGAEGRRLSVARWGVPRRRGGIAINARDDRLRTPVWRAALGEGRVVVPLRGFYEWEAGTRQPWYVHRRDGELLLMAALWTEDPEGRHAAIITTEPSGDMVDIHDRMPAILEPERVEPWLRERDPEAAAELLGPAPEGALRRYPVSRRVNRVANDGPELLEEVTPDATQGELF